MTVAGSGSASNEYGGHLNILRADLGTGYTQSTGPTGRFWLADWGVHGPINLQPNSLNGLTLFANNYYNGSPADSPSAGIWITTQRSTGPAADGVHGPAATYPMDVGLGIVGVSNAGSDAIGFTTGIQVGGFGSPWGESASKVGTGMNISQYATAGINIHAASSTAAPSLIFDTFLQTSEITAPSAPGANGAVVYAKDNGSGKTQMCAKFNTGAEQCFATQP
jgi:hypothetical protein